MKRNKRMEKDTQCSALLKLDGEVWRLIFSFVGGVFRDALKRSSKGFQRLAQLMETRETERPQYTRDAKEVRLEFMQWAREKGAPSTDGACQFLAQRGHLQGLKWARKNLVLGSMWHYRSSALGAAAGGHVSLLEWMVETGCILTGEVGESAARAGQLGTLKWLKENRFPLDDRSYVAAAQTGQLEILKWLKSTGGQGIHKPLILGRHPDVMGRVWRDEQLPFWGTCSHVTPERVHFGMTTVCKETATHWSAQVRDNCVSVAVSRGHLHVLQWLKENGAPLNVASYCSFAAPGGHLEVIKWLRKNGCPWNAGVCSGAIDGGHPDLLKWLKENGAPWDVNACASAAIIGDLETLKWLRENGCPWDAWTCIGAAETGKIEVLKWARENGAPWNEYACSTAAFGGHLEVLKWLREKGCPWDKNTCLRAAAASNRQVLQWAMENGAPCDAQDRRRFKAWLDTPS